jgi:hypothetical protein
VNERIVKVSAADLELTVELFPIQRLAQIQLGARRPCVVTEWDESKVHRHKAYRNFKAIGAYQGRGEQTMSKELSRRSFIHAGVGVVAVTCADAFAQTKPSKPPPFEKDLVLEFVSAGHNDLDKVRKMLDERPRLINATWDWSRGDFEAASGGAGHKGRRDIGQLLIERGARFDLFVAAMMGELDIVKAMIDAFPAAKSSLGPHGIDLMTHAENGGSKNVIEYLKSLG